MYYNLDMWNQRKAEVLELYLQGKSPAVISAAKSWKKNKEGT